MRGHPVANALRRDLVARDQLAVDKHALNRAKGMTVVRIEADAQRGPVLEDHTPRAFELDREQVERIPEPADLKFLAIERAGFDGAAVVVRDEPFVLGEAADLALVWKRAGTRFVASSDQVPRSAVEWDRKFGTRKARARNNRLEIAGQKSLGLAQTPDANELKILFEEDSSGTRIVRLQVCGLAADVRQGVGELPAIVAAPSTQGLAAGLVCRESSEMIVGGPARKLAPFYWLKLAICEFQRIASRCRGNGGPYDRRADEICDHCWRAHTISLRANRCGRSRYRHAAAVAPFSRSLGNFLARRP